MSRLSKMFFISLVRPSRKQRRLWQKISVILLFSVVTVLAECGLIRTFGRSQSGLSGGSGSTVVTSRQGEAAWPLPRWATRGSSSNNLPSADIDEGNARLHGAKRRLADHVLGRWRMRHGDDESVARGEHAMEILGRVDGVEKLGMTSLLKHVACHRDDAHVERPPDLGNPARQVAGAEDGDRLSRDFLAAIAHPAMRPLFGHEVGQAAKMSKECHENELGERAGMDPARRGDEDVGVLNSKRLDVLADTGAGRLDPFQARGAGHIVCRPRQIPQDLGAG